MGTTSQYALPYPEGTDLVIGGDDAMQALAERLEAVMAPAWLDLAEHSGSVQSTDSVGGAVQFPGLVSSSVGWDFDGASVVTYLGPPRPLIVTANLTLQTEVFGVHTAELVVAGVRRRLSEFSVYIPDAGIGRTTHTMQWSGVFVSGATIQVNAYASGGANIWFPSLSVMSTGPRQ